MSFPIYGASVVGRTSHQWEPKSAFFTTPDAYFPSLPPALLFLYSVFFFLNGGPLLWVGAAPSAPLLLFFNSLSCSLSFCSCCPFFVLSSLLLHSNVHPHLGFSQHPIPDFSPPRLCSMARVGLLGHDPQALPSLSPSPVPCNPSPLLSPPQLSPLRFTPPPLLSSPPYVPGRYVPLGPYRLISPVRVSCSLPPSPRCFWQAFTVWWYWSLATSLALSTAAFPLELHTLSILPLYLRPAALSLSTPAISLKFHTLAFSPPGKGQVVLVFSTPAIPSSFSLSPSLFPQPGLHWVSSPGLISPPPLKRDCLLFLTLLPLFYCPPGSTLAACPRSCSGIAKGSGTPARSSPSFYISTRFSSVALQENKLTPTSRLSLASLLFAGTVLRQTEVAE